ncbi:MAG: hypothetical protein MJ175_01050 [Clostridia bacterium]|nr:hypothetical protein [Clostridia bacterium]
MAGLFKRIFKKKPDENSKAFRQEMAEKVAGRHIKYVSERQDGIDVILGKDGSLSIRDGNLIVSAAGVTDVIFRGEITELKISELMSLEGAIITGPDLEHGGMERTIIAYYKYYR